jgi:restriction system protein
MRLEMHKNSLFAILLRSPWWLSLVVAGALFGVLRLFLPALYAGFFALPFVVIACVAAWRQLRAPSGAAVAKKLEAARAMDWKAFSERLEAGLRADGYQVQALKGDDADYEIARAGSLSLLSCKRWKAARTGVEPLRQLKDAARKRKADCVYVAAGELSESAAAFAAQNGIRIVQGAELARLL